MKVSIGCEFQTYDEVDPLTGNQRPTPPEWDNFPGKAASKIIGNWPPNTKIGPVKAVGLHATQRGKLCLCVAVSAYPRPGREQMDPWISLTLQETKLAFMNVPSVTAQALGGQLPLLDAPVDQRPGDDPELSSDSENEKGTTFAPRKG